MVEAEAVVVEAEAEEVGDAAFLVVEEVVDAVSQVVAEGDFLVQVPPVAGASLREVPTEGGHDPLKAGAVGWAPVLHTVNGLEEGWTELRASLNVKASREAARRECPIDPGRLDRRHGARIARLDERTELRPEATFGENGSKLWRTEPTAARKAAQRELGLARRKERREPKVVKM